MAQRDLNATIKNVTVNEQYDLHISQMTELKDLAQHDIWEALRRAFVFGYVMGSRATKAEERQRAEARQHDSRQGDSPQGGAETE